MTDPLTKRAFRSFAFVLLTSAMIHIAHGQSVRSTMTCDPSKVMTSQTCIKCHAEAQEVWKSTPHAKTFDELHRSPKAKEIAKRMGISSIKRGKICVDCHYTLQEKSSGPRVVEGVSCESCHGASKDWLEVHNAYGGRGLSWENESDEHRVMRVKNSISLGMKNPENPYLIARNCLSCHTVPNEKLVNVGGHNSGSLNFELVSWSQGSLRHNFVRTRGKGNGKSDENRLRLLFLSGLVAELEFSVRAVGTATEIGNYGTTVADRAAKSAIKLYQIQQEIKNPLVEEILVAFASAELRTNNSQQLKEIANKIQETGQQISSRLNGSELAAIDKLIPKENQYK